MKKLMVVALLATGCAQMGPTAALPCYNMPSSWRADDQNPIMRLSMLNVGRSCSVSVRNDQRAAEGEGQIVEQPAHGKARVRRVGGVARAEYLPNPGFVGQDSYRARFGPGSQTITVDVTVQAAPGA